MPNAPSSPDAAPSSPAVARSPPPVVPAPVSVAPAAVAAEPRILACVMCQQRKVKCNRKFPCHNCIRLGVNCVPATLHPRRRRRRFPERELLDRVRRYEALLRRNHVRFESLFEMEREGTVQDGDREAASSLASLRHGRDDMAIDSDDEGTRGSEGHADQVSAPTTTTPERGVEAKNFWRAIRKGFHDAETTTGLGSSRNSNGHNNNNTSSVATPVSVDTSDAESDTVPLSTAALRDMWARQLGNTGSLFFRGPHKTLGHVTALHPGPVQIFRLWQIYLENVDPLLKITHTPSLQGRIVEAASHLEGIDPTLEALLFSIYCVAIYSMGPAECQSVFGSSKVDLLGTYQPACEQALLNAGFLRTTKRDCLAAFFLYLLSLGHSIDPRSLYAMLGVAMRLAQSMQINNEVASTAKLTPLEAEMRRRLWWAMALFDARIAELANYSPTMLDPTSDCRLPLNANDVDFRPELKEPPVASSSGTRSEALFAVVRSELGNAMRHMEFYLALSNPALKPMARDREYREYVSAACAAGGTSTTAPTRRKEFAEVDAVEDMIHDKYLQHCDPANGLHYMTIWTSKGFLAKCRLIKYFSKFSQFPATPPSSGSTPSSTSAPAAIEASLSLRDMALADALTIIEADTNVMTSPLTKGYLWLLHLYFPMPAYIYITQELAKRASGEPAHKAWATLNANYEARFSLNDSENRYLFKMFATTILHAWDAYEARVRDLGEPQPVTVPDMVWRSRSQMTETNASSAANAVTDASSTPINADSAIDLAGSGSDVLSTFPTNLSMGMLQPSLFGGAASDGPAAAASGPPSAFGSATPPAPPLFSSLDFGNMAFGTAHVGNWPPSMPWTWGARPSWG